ncbi:MAG: DUF4440 domain-containing protein [Alphaproteobacteria bacterium]|nr:DUF4440 domain-containing protein [Alphaproteobacteria bacterium]
MTEDGRPALLRALEGRLLDPAGRHSADQLSQLLADDFVGFGRSGRVYSKAQIISRLTSEPSISASPVVEIGDFTARTLAPDVMLLTYRLMERDREGASMSSSWRCSIWQLIDCRWQMIFHQGTSIPSQL